MSLEQEVKAMQELLAAGAKVKARAEQVKKDKAADAEALKELKAIKSEAEKAPE